MTRKKPIYAVYDGDVFVSMGTAEEIGLELGIKPSSVKHMSYPSYKKRRMHAPDSRIVIYLEDEEWE